MGEIDGIRSEESEKMNKHIPIVNDFGGAPVAEHDVICPVCVEHPSVLFLNEGTFLPCWDCQRKGWRTYQFPIWLMKLIDFLRVKK